MFKYCKKIGINFNGDDQNRSYTLLHFLCENSPTVELIEYLLKNGAQVNKKDRSSHTKSAIFNLCEFNPSIEMIDLMVKYGSDLNQQNKLNQTPLHYLIKGGKATIKLLEYFERKDVNFQKQDFLKNGVLHFLCLSKDPKIEIFEYLLKKGIDINHKNNYQETAFHFYCSSKLSQPTVEMIHFFGDNGADLYKINRKSENILNLLCSNNNLTIELLKYLVLRKKFKLNAFKSYHTNPFMQYCEYSTINIEILKYFVKNGCSLYSRLYHVDSTLHNICLKNTLTIDIIKFYLENKFDINFKSCILINLFKNRRYEIDLNLFQFLVDNNLNIKKRDSHGKRPLNYYLEHCKKPRIEIIKFFIDNKISKHSRDRTGRTFLYYLCTNKIRPNYTLDIKLINYFLKLGVDINHQDTNKDTIFHYICKNNLLNVEIFNYFLENEANINVKNKLETIPFHYFCQNNRKYSKLFDLFLQNGTNINQKNSHGKTPLHYLCSYLPPTFSEPSVELLQFFITNGAKINELDMEHKLPLNYLFYLRKCASLSLTQIFYENGLISNIQNKYSARIHDIIQKGYITKYKDDKQLLKLSQFLLKVDWNNLENNLKVFYKKKEFTDCEIKGIKVHSKLIEWRTKKNMKQIKKILDNYENENITDFFKWVYYDKKRIVNNNKNKSRLKKKIFDQICSQFELNLNLKKFSLSYSIGKLYQIEDSKDFTIIINKTQKIKCHKFILQARSELFRDLFLISNDSNSIDTINDYSNKSAETMNLVIKYLYVNKIDFTLKNTAILDEMSDVVDYFQLSENCSFNYLLEKIIYESQN
ncbi:ankyrin repeat-containing protein [Anaeramoeba flamelloides]|uniref:Ankyrin repeat-containing protein n=1 Tax=Anaeramoeba flamelloides TaxID=1746091 RepID=A0AAV7ZD13_9EUKA|nr:ankyrin repeat-containing protein [Anaeramoeba flamelloides]